MRAGWGDGGKLATVVPIDAYRQSDGPTSDEGRLTTVDWRSPQQRSLLSFGIGDMQLSRYNPPESA